MSRKKYIISTVIAAIIITGAILLVIYNPFQTPTQPPAPPTFDLSITSHENNSLVKSSTVIIRGSSSGSPDIDDILVNGQNAISLDSNFKKWGVIMNLGPGLNQILIDIKYNITEKTENAAEIWINADTNPYPKDLDCPDSNCLDTNNDGLDGMCDNAIFICQDGSDLNTGDISHPMASIIEGIAKANKSGKDVYVSEGIYNGTVEMIDGISIYGGFIKSDLWSRDESVHPIINSTKEVNNKIIGIKAHNIHSPTYLDTIEIITGNSTSGTSCGIWCYNITDFMLSINNCIIHAGNGGDGANGANGANGQAGSAGNNGVFATGGAGGTGINNGGAGGLAGANPPILPGLSGGYGAGPSGGSGGAGGPLLPLPGPGGAGGNGGNGVNGGNGGVGNGYGTIVNNFWYGFDGNSGGNGGHGSGGGGGGGGACNPLVISAGGGGGGGGGGGQGGLGGAGGTSGGGSIGILLVEANITFTHNTIFTGNGGNGGNGGAGGIGGSGGAGGVPGAQALGLAGGSGGKGGNGGNGGAGGGGAGGLSFGIYCYNSDSLISYIVYTIGTGGSGGTSSGNNGNQGGSGYIYILV
ncbi:MAG: hypothetical protein ACFFAK_16560 [Promethearchaeota archaeon]